MSNDRWANQYSHTEKPKYRCPGCKAQTCSLQCYKRHQQRAFCSGKRDPAAYVKKSQWATPTGIDRDYNYLKGVERKVHDAQQDVSQRGIGVDFPKSKVTLRAWRPDSSLQQYLTANRITIQHAPKGMSRQRENHTRATKSSNVVWTVEWANMDERSLQHDCVASQSLLEHYSLFQVQRRNADKRRLRLDGPGPKKRGNKRRRRQACDTRQLADSTLASEEANSVQRAKIEDGPSGDEGTSLALQDESHADDYQHELERADNHSEISTPSVDLRLYKPEDEDAPTTSSWKHVAPEHAFAGPTPQTKSEDYYYLLKPSTTGVSRVLTPLDPHSSLTIALRDRVVQEYPTIYVLKHPPNGLPNGFSVETDYERAADRAKTASAEHFVKQESTKNDGEVPKNAEAVQELDPTSILEMLKRDIAR